MISSPGNSNFIHIRNTAYACIECLKGEFHLFQRIEQCKDLVETITLQRHIFYQSEFNHEDKDMNDFDFDECENNDFFESEAA